MRFRNLTSGTNSMGHVPPPILQMSGHGGHHEFKNSKHETDQTVLTIKKRSPKRLIVLLEPTKTYFGAPHFAPDRCPVPAPLNLTPKIHLYIQMPVISASAKHPPLLDSGTIFLC